MGSEDVGPRSIASEADLDMAIARLTERDPDTIGHLLSVGGRPPLRRGEAGFEGLASIVVSQQVSTASSAAIFGRLALALRRPEVRHFDARDLAAADDAVLRWAGLSAGKIATLRAVAAAERDGSLPLATLGALPDEDAARCLLAVRGIGPWTAELFLLVCLGRADAWPAGDLALQEAARIALKLEARPDAAALVTIGQRWRPYRAVAARLLWSYYRAVKRRDGTVGATGP
jgi:DNA-3-methyladenine glycosylase II